MQEELRNKLLEIRKKYGTTFSFVADKIGCHRATISLFVAKKRPLPKDVETKLINFLSKTFEERVKSNG